MTDLWARTETEQKIINTLNWLILVSVIVKENSLTSFYQLHTPKKRKCLMYAGTRDYSEIMGVLRIWTKGRAHLPEVAHFKWTRP